MSAPGQRLRIGYLVNAFPVVSETFLVNEVRGIERAGVDIAILALGRRQDRVRPAGTREIRAPVWRPPTLIPWGWAMVLVSHLAAAAHAPASYVGMLRDDVLGPLRRALGSPGRGAGWRRFQERSKLFWLVPLVARQARRAGVVHLHAHYAKQPLEIAARVRWLTGLPYSFAAHAKDLFTTPRRRLARRLTKARFALTCHASGYRALRQLALPEDRRKVVLARHGIDLRLFRPALTRREAGLIVAVGRLTPKKGFDTLIEACSRLKSEPPFRCVILGEGRLESELRRQVAASGLTERVELRGFVDQWELATWYRRAAMVVLPARVLRDGNRDGIPNVLIEAMACGAPVVATSVGGIPELVEDGGNGLLVAPDDPEALRGAVERLRERPGLARRLSAAGRSTARELEFRVCCEPVAARFERQLGKARRARGGTFELPPVDHDRLAAEAARRLGRTPRLRPEVETVIARSVLPGLRANSWRPDLERMAERRLWDELVKARRARELRRFARSMGTELGGSTRVLDLGCGRGGLSVALRAGGVRAVPLDLRLRNCRVTGLRGRRYDFELPAVNGRAEALPFEDRSFDLVCLLEVLEHVADPTALMAEARRVCRADGLCVVTVVNRWAHLDPHYRLWGINFLPRRLAEGIIALHGRKKQSWLDNQRLVDMHYYSFGSFRRFAKAVGFEVHDPWRPEGVLARCLHGLGRRLSLGYNTVTLVLEPC